MAAVSRCAPIQGNTQVVYENKRPEFRREPIEILVAKRFTDLSNKLLFGTGLGAKF